MAAPNYATELAALRKGAASGFARIESDGDVMIYRSVGDIMRAITYFEGLAAASGPAASRSASTIAVYDGY